ncbi:AraC family transcriptional regulator [Nocardioides sp. Soil805]|uniref:AraC family transcriptional regulator n=1 Tax=Nocardioides sp. Soil805 TaxID=1736416 RepID=UPI00070303EC|nr:AraC family transcriptional regulator [Nocardioides sp. Soil805]KRF29409.1 hypothetical protein ASG94_20720 [Nocardioides sp. Soil805]
MPRSRATPLLGRRAALRGYVALARGLDLDAARLLNAQGLRVDALEPDAWSPVDAMARVLGSSARSSGRDDFGLLLSKRRRLSTLGPLSLLLHEEPDVASAVQLLHRNAASYNQALSFSTVHADVLTTIEVTLSLGDDVDPGSARQALELAVAAYLRILRELCAPGWRPFQVQLPHDPPCDVRTHHSVLDTVIVFDAARAAVVLRRDDLDLELQADPQRRAYARRFLDLLRLDSQDAGITGAVHTLIRTRLPSGRCSAELVARDLGMDRRTLHRQLEREGTTFSTVLDEVRAALAEERLRDPHYTVTQVSEALGFAAPSAMSRWFTRRYGCSPTQWRDRLEAAPARATGSTA